MNTNCKALQEDLLAYRDNELSVSRWLVVRWHLAHCAVCREELKIMENISTQIRSSESATSGQNATLDPALRDKILSSVPTADSSEKAKEVIKFGSVPPPISSNPLLHFFQSPKWWATGITLLIISYASVSVMQQGGMGGSASPPAADGPVTASPITSSPSASTSASEAAADSRALGGPVRIGAAAGISAPSTSRQPFSNSSEELSNKIVRAKQQVRASPIQSGGANRAESLVKPPYGTGTNTDNLPSSLRRVHKEASVTVEVLKLEEKSDSVEAMVKSAGGFVADNTLSTSAEGLKTASLSIRVPVQQFETVLGQISKLGEVKTKNYVGEDITEKFSDAQQVDRVLDSELNVKEAQLKQALERESKDKENSYIVPWQQRAEVRELRIQAAQARARLELLKRISDLANISVQLQEKAPTPAQGGFLEGVSETGSAAMDTFLTAARLPVILIIWALAYAPIWLPLLVLYRYLARVYLRDTTNT